MQLFSDRKCLRDERCDCRSIILRSAVYLSPLISEMQELVANIARQTKGRANKHSGKSEPRTMGTDVTRPLKRIIARTMKETSKGPRPVLNWPAFAGVFEHCRENYGLRGAPTRAVGVLFLEELKEAGGICRSFRAKLPLCTRAPTKAATSNIRRCCAPRADPPPTPRPPAKLYEDAIETLGQN